MLTGFVLPGGSATEQLEQAVLAERSGWDGVFVPELAYGVDAWSLLAAMAARTQQIRLGTLLTPLPWRRPWKVASQVATVDQLSSGRAILAVGVGAVDTGLPDTGEETDKRIRAERLDEGIDLVRTLWDGRLSYHGDFYDFECEDDGLIGAVRPVSARIPIWVVGVWPRPKSMRPGRGAGRRPRGAGVADRARRPPGPGRGGRGRDPGGRPGRGLGPGHALGPGRVYVVDREPLGAAGGHHRPHGGGQGAAGCRSARRCRWLSSARPSGVPNQRACPMR
jgi:luciferase-like monooxygenase